MDIIRHGEEVIFAEKKERFVCDHCRCEFDAEEDEYYVDNPCSFSDIHTITNAAPMRLHICSCPECHKIVTKTYPVIDFRTIQPEPRPL